MHLNSWDNFLARIKGQGPEQSFFFFFPLFIQYALTILERNTYCCITLSIKKLMYLWVNNIATIDLTIFILQKNRLVRCLMVATEKLARILVWGLSGNPVKFNRKNYDLETIFFQPVNITRCFGNYVIFTSFVTTLNGKWNNEFLHLSLPSCPFSFLVVALLSYVDPWDWKNTGLVSKVIVSPSNLPKLNSIP